MSKDLNDDRHRRQVKKRAFAKCHKEYFAKTTDFFLDPATRSELTKVAQTGATTHTFSNPFAPCVYNQQFLDFSNPPSPYNSHVSIGGDVRLTTRYDTTTVTTKVEWARGRSSFAEFDNAQV